MSEPSKAIAIFVDADACPVKAEIYRVAERCAIKVIVVSNSPIAVPKTPLIERVVVGGAPDAADDWIAERASRGAIVITADVPLAHRCIKAGADVIAPTGRAFSEELHRYGARDARPDGRSALGGAHHRRSETLSAARPGQISVRPRPRRRPAAAGRIQRLAVFSRLSAVLPAEAWIVEWLRGVWMEGQLPTEFAKKWRGVHRHRQRRCRAGHLARRRNPGENTPLRAAK